MNFTRKVFGFDSLFFYKRLTDSNNVKKNYKKIERNKVNYVIANTVILQNKIQYNFSIQSTIKIFKFDFLFAMFKFQNIKVSLYAAQKKLHFMICFLS
jgi:hypothetical protein